MSEVQYRNIPNYPGYRAGSDGTIWSCKPRNGQGKLTSTWRLLKQTTQWNGRMRVSLSKSGKLRSFSVHRLVLLAFIGPCPKDMESCHNDGNPKNNNLTNLRWDTRLNNKKDEILHGTRVQGRKHWKCKLTEAQVIEIRKRYENGDLQREIGAKFGILQTNVSEIVLRRTWKFLK